MAGVVRVARTIGASREALFEACATTAGLERWYADRVSGSFERGGTVRLEWPGLNAGVELHVADRVENERVVLEGGPSRVTLSIAEGHIALVHEGLAPSEDVPGYDSSWQVALSVLAQALEVHAGRPRRTAWVARPARTTTTLAHLCFTEPGALSTWLGSGEMGSEGERYALTLASGERMSGTVLSRVTGRDLALEWEERGESVLVLRTLPSPTEGERILAACWSRWAAEREDERAVVKGLASAFERLGGILLKSGEA